MLHLQGMVQERFATAQKTDAQDQRGGGGRVLRLVAMLSTSPWKHFPLQVRIGSGPLWRLVGDALRMLVGSGLVGATDSFLLFPEHMGVSVGPLEDFLADMGSEGEDVGDEEGEEGEDGEEGGMEGRLATLGAAKRARPPQ